ncbi:11457_t:CDS:2, partial [Cetraspora pellucida]
SAALRQYHKKRKTSFLIKNIHAFLTSRLIERSIIALTPGNTVKISKKSSEALTVLYKIDMPLARQQLQEVLRVYSMSGVLQSDKRHYK